MLCQVFEFLKMRHECCSYMSFLIKIKFSEDTALFYVVLVMLTQQLKYTSRGKLKIVKESFGIVSDIEMYFNSIFFEKKFSYLQFKNKMRNVTFKANFDCLSKLISVLVRCTKKSIFPQYL